MIKNKSKGMVANLEGYFSTTPNSVARNVIIGTDYTVNFGDALENSTFSVIF